MPPHGFDLAASAREEMIHEGFQPDFPPGTGDQLAAAKQRPPIFPTSDIRDLRNLLWSSIDNDSSRDLDQIEVAERVDGGIRIMVGVADVDSRVKTGTPVDQHAAKNTT